MKIAILLLSFLVLSPASSISRELSPLEINKLKSLVKDLKPLAEEGKPAAQNNLGELYFSGYGVEQSYEEALKWFQRAAAQDFAQAQYNLGLMYYHGNGTNIDKNETIKYLNLACENRFVQGCIDMVTFVRDDNKKAEYYHTKACELGYQTSCAMLKLGENKIEEAKSIMQVECEKGEKNACNILQQIVNPLIEKKGNNPMDKGINKAFSYVIYINIAIIGLLIAIGLFVSFIMKARNKSKAIKESN